MLRYVEGRLFEYLVLIYSGKGTILTRQWREVYDLCHTFLYVERVKKPTAMRESHARIARDSRMAVGFLTRATCKNVRQNLIPHATA